MSDLKSIIVAMAGCLFPVLCLGTSPKLAPDLPTYGPGTLDVIVQFAGQQSETPPSHFENKQRQRENCQEGW